MSADVANWAIARRYGSGLCASLSSTACSALLAKRGQRGRGPRDRCGGAGTDVERRLLSPRTRLERIWVISAVTSGGTTTSDMAAESKERLRAWTSRGKADSEGLKDLGAGAIASPFPLIYCPCPRTCPAYHGRLRVPSRVPTRRFKFKLTLVTERADSQPLLSQTSNARTSLVAVTAVESYSLVAPAC